MPRVVAGIAGMRDGVEAPNFLAGLGIVGFDKAGVASLAACASGYYFAVDHERAGGILRFGLVSFPAHFACARVERNHVAIGCREIDHVLINRERFGALVRGGLRIFEWALIFPN